MIEKLGGRKFVGFALGITALCIFVKDDTQFVVGLLGLVSLFFTGNVLSKKVSNGNG
jgi:hypothetical protein